MNPGRLSEDALVEQPALRLLSQLGWEVASGFDEVLGSAGTLGRDSQSEPVLGHRLRDALRTLNPVLPDSALDEAAERLVEDRSAMGQVRANRVVYDLLREGAKVETSDGDGERRMVTVRFVDWNRVEANDWLAVSQFWIAGDMYRRRADVVLFVNGIPLVFIELKVSHKNVRDAYDANLRDYRDTVPHLFWFNAFVVLSNGADTLVGSTSAPWGHFAEWKKIDSEGEQGVVSLETALRGTCERHRLLDLVENFVAFMERPGGLVKAFAKNHQFLGVNNSLEALRESEAARRPAGGVLAHAGVGQVFVDAVVYPEGAAQRARQLDFRAGHRPQGARRAVVRGFRRLRGDHFRPGGPCGDVGASAGAVGPGPPVRVHADPQVHPA